MSDVVNTSTVGIYRGQNHPGSIPVPVRGITAELAPEGSLCQFEPLLGYRVTTRTGHRGVSGRNQYHLPARPLATLDQLPLRRTDRSIRGLTRHPRACQKLRLEILHRDYLVISHDTTRPHPGSMRVLPGRLLLQPRGRAPGLLVALRRGLSTGTCAAGHLSLRLRQLRRAPLAMTTIGQVEGRVSRGRCRSHTPVDANPAVGSGQRLDVTADHERRVPVTETVLIDPNRGRCRRQLTRPHHRDRYPTGQSQSAVTDRETAGGVLERGQRPLPRLDCGAPTTGDPVRVIERGGEGAQRLLLGDLRTIAQPRRRRASCGEQLRELAERRLGTATLLVDGLVPQEPAAMPLPEQCALRRGAGAQAVGVSHSLEHAFDNTGLRQSTPPSSPRSAAHSWRSSNAVWCNRRIRETHSDYSSWLEPVVPPEPSR